MGFCDDLMGLYQARERTPYSEPRTERMTIAKREITTLSTIERLE